MMQTPDSPEARGLRGFEHYEINLPTTGDPGPVSRSVRFIGPTTGWPVIQHEPGPSLHQPHDRAGPQAHDGIARDQNAAPGRES